MSSWGRISELRCVKHIEQCLANKKDNILLDWLLLLLSEVVSVLWISKHTWLLDISTFMSEKLSHIESIPKEMHDCPFKCWVKSSDSYFY